MHDVAEASAPAVLIVEDDANISNLLLRFLTRSGMRAWVATTGREAAELKDSLKPNVVLLDLALPDTNGISLIPLFARTGDCGIIVLTGSGEEVERVTGIELGADDYIVKPPSLRELVARIRAVHRRVSGRAAAGVPDHVPMLRLAYGEVDLRKGVVITQDGQRTALTGAENKALELLVAARGQPLSRDELCRQALRRPLGSEDRAVDQLIVGLRKKLSALNNNDQVIVSIRGAGYALQA